MKLRHFALASALALACSSGEETPKTAPEQPAPETPAPEEPAAVPGTPAPEEPPPTPAAADAAAGARVYSTYCASCHGERGAGDGPVSASLNPKPARHDDGAYMNALSNEHLVAVVKLGGPAVGKSPMMAPWGGVLSDQQIRDIVAFMRSLADPPYEGPQP